MTFGVSFVIPLRCLFNVSSERQTVLHIGLHLLLLIILVVRYGGKVMLALVPDILYFNHIGLNLHGNMGLIRSVAYY